MSGKVAIILGAGQGMMRAAAIILANEGAKVVVADIDEGKARNTADEINSKGQEASWIRCDVSIEEEVKGAIAFAVKTYGGLHYAVNGVGISHDFVPISEVSTEGFNGIFNANVNGMYYGLKYEIPAIIKTGAGAIVNIGSAAGLVGMYRQGAYNATKHAVVGLTKCAAMDYATLGVRVNCVCPGPTASTNLRKKLEEDPHFADQYLVDVPMKRMMDPVECAEAIVWLCSDCASGITGVMLPVDGGMVAH